MTTDQDVAGIPGGDLRRPPGREVIRLRRLTTGHRMAGALFRCAAATGSGALLFLSFPPLTMWFLAPVGIAVLTLVLRGRSLRAGFGYGYLAGLPSSCRCCPGWGCTWARSPG